MAQRFKPSFDVERVHSTFKVSNKASSCSMYHVRSADLPGAVLEVIKELKLSIHVKDIWIGIKPSKNQQVYYGCG